MKNAAIQNIPECLKNLSTEKICNLMIPTLKTSYQDSTAGFKAGSATSLCEMAQAVGKQFTTQKIMPILMDLLKDESPEVKLNVVSGLSKIANVVGQEMLDPTLLSTLSGMTKDGQWRVRMGVFELIADLAIVFGKDIYKQHLQSIFMGYLTNTAASVRKMGIKKAGILAEKFQQEWIMKDFIPTVINHYSGDKKGYNFRVCCLSSLSVVIPYI